MTKLQAESVSIGKAYSWHHDGPSIHHSDETVTGYRINGLPSHLTADLGPTQGFGRWAFYAYRGSEVVSPKNSFDSKEEAFAAFKNWLRSADVI